MPPWHELTCCNKCVSACDHTHPPPPPPRLIFAQAWSFERVLSTLAEGTASWHTSCCLNEWHCKVSHATLCFAGSGGSPAAAAPISNGHTADPQNGTDQVLGLDSSSEASDSNPPQDPEPELDQFDHERPIDMGPIAGREQVGRRSCDQNAQSEVKESKVKGYH